MRKENPNLVCILELISTSLNSLKNKVSCDFKNPSWCAFCFPSAKYSFEVLDMQCIYCVSLVFLEFPVSLLFVCNVYVTMNYFQVHELDMSSLYCR